MQETIHYYASLPLLEFFAVISALIYVVLAAKGNIWCWPAALVSTILYTAIFYDVYLWMDSLLQVYYMVMAVYGWLCWRKVRQPTDVDIVTATELLSNVELISNKCSTLAIQTWAFKTHLVVITVLTLLSGIVGWLMATYTPTDFPYYDAATTVFAVFTTYMVTKKVLENWLYWLVIDLLSIYIYLEKGLTPTAVLFGFYVIIALYGYYQWYQSYRSQAQVLAN